MSLNDQHDNTLFAILSDCRTLPAFLDVVFGFLKRRTDFYYVAEDKNAPVGLPVGFAENIVKQAFFKWQNDKQIIKQENVEPKLQEICDKNATTTTKPIANETFTSSESYNGAVLDKYSWSQSITDLDIIVKIPENATKKDLDVKIESQKICVKMKNDSDIFLEGDFSHRIKHSEAFWSLDKTKLIIHLEKCAEIWWDQLITSEDKLDISKIDCSRPFEELSEEARSKIEELTWNQERKRLGLPTSDQLSLENALKKAWNADGSPFTGPYDPSSVMLN